MIGLDTNVLIRYLTQDDHKQSAKVNQLFENAEREKSDLWVSLVTLCEIAWVLESCYQVSRKELALILHTLFQIKQVRIEEESIAQAALVRFEAAEKVDFSDCLIGIHNGHHHCIHTVTFDKQAGKLKEFSLL